MSWHLLVTEYPGSNQESNPGTLMLVAAAACLDSVGPSDATEANCSGMFWDELQSTMAIAWLVGMVGSGIASTIAVCCMALLDLA